MRRVKLSKHDELLLTRERGRAIAKQLPHDETLVLDFDGVRVASPSFLDELLRGADQRGAKVSVENASPKVRESLKRIHRVNDERLAEAQ